MPDTEGLIIAKADRMKDCEPTRLTLGEKAALDSRHQRLRHRMTAARAADQKRVA
jgi:hypothetical protein